MLKPIVLPHRNLLTLFNQGRITIFCAQGQLWITVPNDQLDYILHTGMSISVETRGACVIEALQSATLINCLRYPRFVLS